MFVYGIGLIKHNLRKEYHFDKIYRVFRHTFVDLFDLVTDIFVIWIWCAGDRYLWAIIQICIIIFAGIFISINIKSISKNNYNYNEWKRLAFFVGIGRLTIGLSMIKSIASNCNSNNKNNNKFENDYQQYKMEKRSG